MFATPECPSLAISSIVVSWKAPAPVSAVYGAVPSQRTVAVFVVSTSPALSLERNSSVLLPSIAANGAVYVVRGPPAIRYFVQATPVAASVASRLTVTVLVAQPEDGKPVAVVVGGSASRPTVAETDPMRPPASRSHAVIVLMPSADDRVTWESETYGLKSVG